ncbi:MAG: enolase C-terminal domain-like protein [Planctomycetota bacterium]
MIRTDAAEALCRRCVSALRGGLLVLLLLTTTTASRAEVVLRGVELYRFELPLKSAFTTSKGSSDTCYGIFVRLLAEDAATGEAYVGLGSILPRTLVTNETLSDAWAGAVEMRRQLLSDPLVFSGDQLARDFSGVVDTVDALSELANQQKLTTRRPPAGDRQLRATLCGYDQALLDLLGQIYRQPIWQLLNDAGRPWIKRSTPTYSVTDSPEKLSGKIAKLHSDYDGVRIKIGRDMDHDLAALAAAAATLVDAGRGQSVIWVDVNQAWRDASTSVARLEEIADTLENAGFTGTFLVEQPTDEHDYEALAQVTAAVRGWADSRPFTTQTIIDESIWILADVKRAVEMDAADLVNLKLQKTGGMIEAMRIGAYLAEHAPQTGVYIGGLVMTDVGAWGNVQLCFALPRLDYQTSGAPRHNFPVNVADQPLTYSQLRRIARPTTPGLGTGLDMEQLEPYITRRYVED